MADTPLRSLLAEFVVQVDRAGALAKGNAQVDALKKKLEQLGEAAKPAAQAVGDAFAQAGGSQFTRRAQANVLRGRGSEDAFLQLGKTGGPLLPGLLRPLRQETPSAPGAPPREPGYQTPDAIANVFARAAAGAQRNLQALNASSFTGGGSGDGFLSAAFRTPGSAPQFGPTRETLNAARAATAAAEAEAAKYAGTLRGKLATAVQAVRDGFERGGGGGSGSEGGGLIAKLSSFRTQLQLLAGSAVVVGIKRVVEGIGDIKTGAQRLGVSTTEFQRLDVLAKQNGTSVDALGTAYRNLSKAAVEPTKQTASAFTQLGVQTKDASGHFKSADDLFWDTIGALAGVTDETKRNALAQNVLGRSALQLKPLFADGTAAVQAQREALAQLNVLSPETIEQAHKLSDTWKEFGPRLLKAGEPLLKVLIPALQQLTDLIIRGTDSLGKFLKQTSFTGAALAVFALITLNQFIPAVSLMIGLCGGAEVAFAALAGAIWSSVAPLLAFLLPAVAFEDFISFVTGKKSLIGEVFEMIGGKKMKTDILDALAESWKVLASAIKTVLTLLHLYHPDEEAQKKIDEGVELASSSRVANKFLAPIGSYSMPGTFAPWNGIPLGTPLGGGSRIALPDYSAPKSKSYEPNMSTDPYDQPEETMSREVVSVGATNVTINMLPSSSAGDIGREVASVVDQRNQLISQRSSL